MARRSGWVLLAFLMVAGLAPGAEAGLTKSYSFQVDLPLVKFGGNESREGLGVTLLTGRLEAHGERSGLYGFVSVRSGTVTDASKVEVLNTRDQAGAINRAISGQCDNAQACAVEATYLDPTVTVAADSTFILYTEAAFNYTATAPFLLMTVAQPPKDLGGGAIQNLSIEPSLLLVGDAVEASARASRESDAIYAILPNDNSTITIAGENQSKQYSGSSFVFRFYGTPRFSMGSSGMLLPFQGSDARASLTPASGAAIRDQFRPETVNDVLRGFGSNQSVVSSAAAKQFREIAPILNGVLFGGVENPIVDAKTRDNVTLSLIRFAALDLSATQGGARAAGSSPFVLLGTGFHTTSSGFTFGVFAVPGMSILLWVLAAGAIVAGFVLKPIVAPQQAGGMGMIRLIGLGFHAVALVLAFILWDAEIRGFLGTSLITLLTGGDAPGAMLGITAVFEMVPFGMALLLLGMPIRFIINSGLKLGGLKKARGIGKGVGDLAAWGLGAPFIPFFLNGFVALIVEALSKALG